LLTRNALETIEKLIHQVAAAWYDNAGFSVDMKAETEEKPVQTEWHVILPDIN